MNDENAPPLPLPNVDAAVDYVPSENLEALSDPDVKIQLKSLIEDLESKDWLKVCELLNTARRFAIHHSTLMFPNLEKVILVLIKSMKNPRSALCKTSIMAASDVFNAFGDQLLVDPTISAAAAFVLPHLSRFQILLILLNLMVKPAKGTTTMSFNFKEGVMLAADSRASMGGYICTGSASYTKKFLPPPSSPHLESIQRSDLFSQPPVSCLLSVLGLLKIFNFRHENRIKLGFCFWVSFWV